MAGDVVKRARVFSGGAISEDKILSWLAGMVRELRKSPEVPMGPAGVLRVSAETGTVEIDPRTKRPMPGHATRTLSFTASAAFLSVVKDGVLSDDRLARLEEADAISSCFAKALAAELMEHRKAVIGNFGTWTLGRLPDLTVFVRFRSRPAIDRMLT